jgi:hypothetical protein
LTTDAREGHDERNAEFCEKEILTAYRPDYEKMGKDYKKDGFKTRLPQYFCDMC